MKIENLEKLNFSLVERIKNEINVIEELCLNEGLDIETLKKEIMVALEMIRDYQTTKRTLSYINDSFSETI